MSDEGFADFESFDDPPIRLPYKGKVYELPPVDAELGLWIVASRSGAKTPLSKMSDEEQIRRLVGDDTYDQMLADKVPAKFFARVQLTAMAEFTFGRDAAEVVWRTGVDPEAVAAEVAATEASSSTDEGGKTPTPDSMSATTSRKKPQDRKPKASRSRTSSGSGARSRRTGGSSTTSTSKTT